MNHKYENWKKYLISHFCHYLISASCDIFLVLVSSVTYRNIVKVVLSVIVYVKSTYNVTLDTHKLVNIETHIQP